MRTEIICIAIAALMWGGYPLVARSTGVGGPLGTLIISLAGLLPTLTALLWQGSVARPSGGELLRLSVAGMMMGVGLLAFNFVANSRQIDASVSIPMIDTAMLVVSVLAAIIFFAEPLTIKKVIGIGLLIAGIVVLKPT